MEYIKKDSHTLKVQNPVKTIKAEVKEYTLSYLKGQEIAIQAQIDRHTEKFRKDLEEVQKMIEEAERLGIVVEEEELASK